MLKNFKNFFTNIHRANSTNLKIYLVDESKHYTKVIILIRNTGSILRNQK